MKNNVLRKILAMTKLGFYGFLLQCIAFSFLIADSGLAQQQSINDVYLSVHLNDGKLIDVFKEIESKTGFNFSYNDALVKENELISLNFTSQSLGDILSELSRKTRLKFKRINENIHVSTRQIFEKAVTEEQLIQGKTVSGKITSLEDGSGLPGVNVVVKGTSNGTVTDIEGNFVLEVEGENSILEFSSVGFISEEVLVGNRSIFDITLSPDITALEEIVVVGYGTQQRGDLTGSVSSVKGEAIKNVPARNLAEALQGRVAGVQITDSGGRPGSGADIIIRGAGSVNGTPPLYIVDGIRIGTGNNFNLQDIESVEVMKDASAAAIYGAQAAGGVILITTKRGGKSDKINVNLNARYGFRTPTGLYDLLETPDYITAKRAIGANDPTWDNPSQLANTDWHDELFRTGQEQNYNISMDGGGDKANYYLGFNYQREDGIIINNYFQRFNLRLNSDFDISDKITIGESLMAWKTNENPPAGGSGEPFRSTPTMPLKDPDDPATETGDWAKNPSGFSGGHPVANQYINHYNTDQYGLEGNVYLNWSIVRGLDFRTNLGAQLTNRDEYQFTQFADWGSNTQPQRMVKELSNWQQYTSNFVLTYQTEFGKSNLKVMAGYEAIKSTSDRLRGEAGQFPTVVAESFDIKLDANPLLQGGPGNGRFESVFGRLNYDYNGKYLLQATIRRDGSDKFGPNNKWGTFPSVSVGWKLSDEAFLSGVDFVDNLKLRASYGVLGNDNIGQFAYESAFARINVHSFDDNAEVVGYSSVKFPNQSIKWEEITTTDIGVDFTFLDKSFDFTFDWYKKITTDMLYNVNIPLTSGYGRHNSNPTSVPVNIGEIENTGVEFTLNYYKKVGGFNLNVGANASFNNNKVIDLGEGNVPINEGGAGFAYNGSFSRTENDYPMGSFYGYEVIGIFKTDAEVQQLNDAAPGGVYQNSQTAAGDLHYADINGDGVINDDDRTIIGNPWPKTIYGLNIGLGFKGFEFNMLFSGVAGVDLFNGNKAYAQTIYGDYNTTDEIFNASFYGNNGLTNQPRIGGDDASGNFIRDPNGNYSRPSSYFIEDGSYVKLKNLQVAYNLPKSIVSNLNMSSVRIYFTGQNLFTITNYTGRDPEIAGGVKSRGIDYFANYPHTRLYAFGIELGF